METKRHPAWGAQAIIGVFIVAIGLLITLDNIEVMNAAAWLRFWPLVFVALGGFMTLRADTAGARVWGAAVALIGVLLIARNFEWLSFSIMGLWPLVLILIGGGIVLRSMRSARGISSAQEASSVLNGLAIMSGFNRSVTTHDFQGGEITAIMGGAEIDLRGATITRGEAVLNVFAFWGGVELHVPHEWNVQVVAIPILGGFEDKTQRPLQPGAPRLVVRGYAIMGGMEIHN